MSPTLLPRDRPDWNREGKAWPNRETSRFVSAAGLRWHVQRCGRGPTLLLAHGTGAATHSWRGLLPVLAKSFDVIAPDLPGHGFTEAPPSDRLSLPGMSDALGGLVRALGAEPDLAVGHSAGAAILMRMCLKGVISPRALVSLNGALMALRGLPGQVFSPVARVLARSSLVPRLFALRASKQAMVDRLIAGTGSKIDPEGLELYARLARKPGHAAAALGMMANWNLLPLEQDMRRLKVPLVLVVGDRDRTIPPRQASLVAGRVPAARVIRLPNCGHLAHEEALGDVAEIIADTGREHGLLRPSSRPEAPDGRTA